MSVVSTFDPLYPLHAALAWVVSLLTPALEALLLLVAGWRYPQHALRGSSSAVPASSRDELPAKTVASSESAPTSAGVHATSATASTRATVCGATFGDASSLPQELVTEIARGLDLSDVAALGSASSSVRQHTWQEPGVWRAVAERSGIDVALCLGGEQLSGDSAREAFRRHNHSLDVSQLNTLREVVEEAGRDALAELLKKLAQMATGLMPRDGAHLAEQLVCTAERALQVHDPTHVESVAAVERILQIARRRYDVFSWLQREHLECAQANARHVQVLMDDIDHDTSVALDDVIVEDDSMQSPIGGVSVDEERLHDLCTRFEDLIREAGFVLDSA